MFRLVSLIAVLAVLVASCGGGSAFEEPTTLDGPVPESSQGAATSGTATSAGGGLPVEVTIENGAFHPAQVTLYVDHSGVVEFRNLDDLAYEVVADDGEFAAFTVEPNAVAAVDFAVIDADLVRYSALVGNVRLIGMVDSRPRRAGETAVAVTTEPATTTTEAGAEPWVEGSLVLRAGDCFVEHPAAGEDPPDREVVPCDTPHSGEVVGTGSDCPVAIGSAQFGALVADYVGVPADQVFDWMERHQLTGHSSLRVGEDGRVAGTMCVLAAEDGDLTESYRAGSG